MFENVHDKYWTFKQSWLSSHSIHILSVLDEDLRRVSHLPLLGLILNTLQLNVITTILRTVCIHVTESLLDRKHIKCVSLYAIQRAFLRLYLRQALFVNLSGTFLILFIFFHLPGILYFPRNSTLPFSLYAQPFKLLNRRYIVSSYNILHNQI